MRRRPADSYFGTNSALRRWAITVAITVAGASFAAPAAGAERAGDYVVVLKPGAHVTAVSDAQAQRVGIRVDRIYRSAVRGYSGQMTPAAARSLRTDPAVLSVEPDAPVWAVGQTTPTGLDRIAAPAVSGDLGSATTVDGSDERVDVDIAVIDTGAGPHPDLNVVMRTDCTGPTCIDGVGNDANGHGTHVAGTAAALDNGFGVVGVAPGARIWSVRVLDALGNGSLSGVIAGIDWVTSHADVIDVANVSIGCDCVSPALDAALSASTGQGVTYAVAAGNSAVDSSGFAISGNPDVITTSALADSDGVSGGVGGAFSCRFDVDDTLADFSSFGASVDLAAPGVCIRSTWLGAGYNTISGTSMASPHVAGAAALLASQPAYRGDPVGIQAALVSAGNLNWSDTSGDGAKEPLLEISGFTPVMLPNAPPVTLSVEDSWVAEGSSPQVRVRLSRALAGGEVVTASVKSADGTAVAGADYAALPATTVRLVAGQSEATVPLTTLADTKPEGHETFTLAVSKVVGAVLADSSATVTIYDPNGPLGLSVSSSTVPESGGTASVAVSLDSPVPSGHQVTVKVQSADLSARAGADYAALPLQTLTFTAGQQSKTLSTTITDDSMREGNETFSVNLTTTAGARLVDSTGSVTILDDEGPTGVSVGNARVPEGNSGTTVMNFPVTLSAAPTVGQVVTVTLKTANSTAVSGSDYVAISSTTLTFAAGELSKNVPVTVFGDTTVEADEVLKLSITTATGATVSDTDGYGTISNDDGAVPGADPHWLSVSDGWLSESPAGRSGVVTLTLSSAPLVGETVQVTVAAAAGTATSGSDFVAVPATTVVFGVGETQHTVDIAALDDSLNEPTETFAIALAGAVGAIVVDTSATVSIVSDEAPLTASIDDPWLFEGNSVQSIATATVRLSAAPAAGQTISVKVATKAGTASAGSDYVTVPSTTLSFTAGQTSRTVAVTVNGDLLHEGSEAFTVTLTTAVGLAIADTDGSVTLVDEEGPITASLVETEAVEGQSGSTPGALTVRLSDAPQAGQSLTLKLGTTTGGTATAAVDYLSQALAVVTFAPGEIFKTLPVTVLGDLSAEQNETVRLTASTPTGGLVLTDASADLRILNDD